MLVNETHNTVYAQTSEVFKVKPSSNMKLMSCWYEAELYVATQWNETSKKKQPAVHPEMQPHHGVCIPWRNKGKTGRLRIAGNRALIRTKSAALTATPSRPTICSWDSVVKHARYV